jgi:flagellar biosynthesis/type III secretory pathway chaperone
MIMKGQFRDWQALAEAIREELRECAWLLSLLDRQQKAIIRREIKALAEINESVKEQTNQVAQAREARIDLMVQAAENTVLLPGSALADLVPVMPEVVRPLFDALAKEAASLRKRIRRRTEQNHRLLERASTNVSGLLENVHPGSVTRTYGRKGNFHTSSGLRGSVVHTAV